MKKDIDFPKVEGVVMAITRQKNQETKAYEYFVYLINDNKIALENVLINSYGYSKGSETKTSTLRHFTEKIDPLTSFKVEAIMPELFKLVNQFWVSYYMDGVMYDKKFVFMPESMNDDYFSFIEAVQMEGVLHA